MFLNKRYLAGFGIFVAVAGLYGFISFTSYSSFENSNGARNGQQANVQNSVPVSAPVPATQVELNASPNADVQSASASAAPSAAAGEVPFVGPPTEMEFRKAAEKNGVSTKDKVGSTSSTGGKPLAEIQDPTANQKTENVYGPVDPSLKVESADISAKMPKARAKKTKQVADEVASDFDVIASADQALNDEQQPDTRESWLKSLGISMKQYRLIQQREERLAKEVKTAEREKAIGSKELLVAEYQEWLLEYLGPDRYAKFSELAAK